MKVKKLQGKRGAHGAAQIYGEVLFAPGADVDRWGKRFQERIYYKSIAGAPVHDYGKRPLRPHPGKHLKNSFIRSRPFVRKVPGGAAFFAAVGNSRPYSAYVDQGTGIYNGRGAYPAKVLPPYSDGSPSLYEHTWRPGYKPVAPVMIKGQKPQFYFEKALNAATLSMMRRSYQLPGEGISGMGGKWITAYEPAFPGNTVPDAAFILDLQQWRRWRDEAWAARKNLGEGEALTRYATARQNAINAHIASKAATSAARKEARRLRKNATQNEKRRHDRENRDSKSTRKEINARIQSRLDRMQRDWIKHWKAVHKGFTPESPQEWGFWYKGRGGSRHKQNWPAPIADLYAELGVQHKPAPRNKI